MSFQAGFNKGVSFQPTGLGVAVTFYVTGHSWSEMIDKIDVTHSGTGGIQALLAGILRGDGNMKANCDSGQIVSNPSNGLRAGTNGIMNFYFYDGGTFGLGTNPFSVPCMVIKVNYKSEVAGKTEYDCDVSLNALANNSSGVGGIPTSVYTRPS